MPEEKKKKVDVSELATIPSLESLKEEAEKSIHPPTPPVVNEDDPKLKEEYGFHFRWVDGRGKVWEGDFTNRILDMGQEIMLGQIRAKLAGGMPVQSLEALPREINLMISHLQLSLVGEKPEWAQDLYKVKNVQLLQALYAEVAAHIDTFHGWEKAAPRGAEAKK